MKHISAMLVGHLKHFNFFTGQIAEINVLSFVVRDKEVTRGKIHVYEHAKV